MKKISFNIDTEQEGMLEELKQDFFNKTQVDLTNSQLLTKLIYDAWEQIDPEIKMRNR